MDFETQKTFLETKIASLTSEAVSLQAILDNLNNGYSAPLASLAPLISERDSLKADTVTLNQTIDTLENDTSELTQPLTPLSVK